MRHKQATKLLHDSLLTNYNELQKPLEWWLKDLESKRAGIHENNRKELETKIDVLKGMIKAIDNQEQRLREIFDYLDYNN